MNKKYTYSASEFFYDRSFKDYEKNYVLKYHDRINDRIVCPTNIVYDQIFITPFKNENVSKNNMIGVFNPTRDEIGIYGSYMIDNWLGMMIKKLFEESDCIFSPIGYGFYNQNHEIVTYYLQGLHIRYDVQ